MITYYLIKRSSDEILCEGEHWESVFRLSGKHPLIFPNIHIGNNMKSKYGKNNCRLLTKDAFIELYGFDPTMESYLIKPNKEEKAFSSELKTAETNQEKPEEIRFGKGANTEVTVKTEYIESCKNFIYALDDMIKMTRKKNETLPKEQSQIDKQIQDELHYIEFNSLSAADGFKAYQRMHEKRVERRKNKNESEILFHMQAILNRIDMEELRATKIIIDQLPERTYCPKTDQYPEKI